VKQSGGMNVFNHTAMFNDRVVGFAPTEFCSEKGEHGADTFASTTHQIGADSWNQGNI